MVDLSDAFCQLGLGGLASYMCLDHFVRAEEFGVTEVFDNVSGEWSSVAPHDQSYPALAMLPVGFVLSLFFVP